MALSLFEPDPEQSKPKTFPSPKSLLPEDAQRYVESDGEIKPLAEVLDKADREHILTIAQELSPDDRASAVSKIQDLRSKYPALATSSSTKKKAISLQTLLNEVNIDVQDSSRGKV